MNGNHGREAQDHEDMIPEDYRRRSRDTSTDFSDFATDSSDSTTDSVEEFDRKPSAPEEAHDLEDAHNLEEAHDQEDTSLASYRPWSRNATTDIDDSATDFSVSTTHSSVFTTESVEEIGRGSFYHKKCLTRMDELFRRRYISAQNCLIVYLGICESMQKTFDKFDASEISQEQFRADVTLDMARLRAISARASFDLRWMEDITDEAIIRLKAERFKLQPHRIFLYLQYTGPLAFIVLAILQPNALLAHAVQIGIAVILASVTRLILLTRSLNCVKRLQKKCKELKRGFAELTINVSNRHDLNLGSLWEFMFIVRDEMKPDCNLKHTVERDHFIFTRK